MCGCLQAIGLGAVTAVQVRCVVGGERGILCNQIFLRFLLLTISARQINDRRLAHRRLVYHRFQGLQISHDKRTTLLFENPFPHK
jgi:hypothetical protein